MRVPSEEEAALRTALLQRFHDMGFHPRLLSHLRGQTADEQWESLRRLVCDPDFPPEFVLRGRWHPYWHQLEADPS